MPILKKFTFKKEERLCSQKAIGRLFTDGKGMFHFPFRLVYSLSEKTEHESPVRIVISVPKRTFKRAVKRNLIKRRIREAYRHHKSCFYEKLPINYSINIMLIYVSTTIASYAEIEPKLASTLSSLAKRIEKDINIPSNSIN